MKDDKLNAHLQVDRYGEFWLTGAVRPGPHLPVIPREGYRQAIYRDPRNRIRTPVLAASVSKERLFDAFLAMMEPLGEEVDIVLETSHAAEARRGRGSRGGAAHRDLQREQIDRPVLESHLYDYEELLLEDGCTGIAVVSTTQPMELQFDEHKLLVVYAHDLKPFAAALKKLGVGRDDDLKLISEAEHLHSSKTEYEDLFEQMAHRLGVGEAVESINW